MGGRDNQQDSNHLKTFIMKKNMGNTDRIVRLILAAVFGYLFFSGTVVGVLGYVLVALGAIFILTSFISFCPLYTLIGMSTCPVKQS
mgnify:CR=1 FL=1